MNAFAPIAIVGRSCLLPRATTPAALFEASLQRHSLLSATPRDRWRGLDPDALVASNKAGARVASATGGYVIHPDLDVARVAARVKDFDRLDPLVHWLSHCAVQALHDLEAPGRAGMIVGNLSYPSSLGAAFVEDFWNGKSEVDPRNRFSSGLPVHLVANALGMEGPAFAIDAACASSLYAIKLACDALHDGDVDVMLAGGINRADDLFLHLGFTALQALSPSGQSRPFHAEADGLVPSEGAALVALKRLTDAERAGDRIYGIISAAGLSNDGRQNGFLAPSVDGQVSAMTAALAQAGVNPREIDFVDCHATGTVRGDAAELESLVAAYGEVPLILGALKGNLGHAITASGAASVVNVLSAMEAGVIPPARCDVPIVGIKATAFTLPAEPMPWDNGRKRAAISNFGFGGNNAHLIVESHVPKSRRPAKGRTPAQEIVICGLGVVAGDVGNAEEFRRRAFGPVSAPKPAQSISLDLAGLGFPPSDLKASLAQQTAMLVVASEALTGVTLPSASRTGVIVGMGCDATIARHGLRARADNDWIERNAAAAPMLTAESVIGCMPNIPANRIHAQKDFRGFGFTVSSEELSGVTALRLAIRALQHGELDAVLVGAVDFSCESAHAAAALAVLGIETSGDAAVAFLLKRRDAAERDGDPVLCALDVAVSDAVSDDDRAATRFGHAHAACGALQIASLVLSLQARGRVDVAGIQPAPGRTVTTHRVESFSSRADLLTLSSAKTLPRGSAVAAAPMSMRYAANTIDELATRMEAREAGGEGAVRCALIAETSDELERLRSVAQQQVRRGEIPQGPGIVFAAAPMSGELAFTFTGAAAAYVGAGRELLLAWPEIGDALAARHAGTGDLARPLYDVGRETLSPRVQLTGCALVCQAHAEFSRNILGLAPKAAIGLSSGETNALLAFGVWRDLDAMLTEIDASGLYGDALTGAFSAAAKAWSLQEGVNASWSCWRIAAPREIVEAALAPEARAYMTIVQAPDDCVIGGEPEACRRVVDRVGRSRAMSLGLDMIVHCEAMAPFADAWRRIHTRDVYPCSEVRFYSNADNAAYSPTRESAAEAITRQALEPIDFPKTIRAAWDDGVRIFVEHGPRAILTGAIGRILEGRPHLAVALDSQERRGLRALAESVSRLWVNGVAMNLEAFDARMDALRAPASPDADGDRRKLVLPAHRPDIVSHAPTSLSVDEPRAPPTDVQLMACAPAHLEPLAMFASVQARTHDASDRKAAGSVSDRTAAALGLVTAVGEAHASYVAHLRDTHAEFLKLRGKLVTAVSGARVEASVEATTSQPVSLPVSLPRRHSTSPLQPLYNRSQLETLAGGRISDVFGPLFRQQDGLRRQVRMPQPPLLFADRVMELEGEPGSMGRGRIVTETEVIADAWYMHAGRMVPGVVIESGQADLLLASWLGADFLNRGERVYRLLGCDLTFMGELPEAGDTLRYDIHIDGHAKTGETRLFFFHYDCFIGDRLMISVRNGQAGFFSDDELRNSSGVLWDAEEDAPAKDSHRDPTPLATSKRHFGKEEVAAFVAGKAWRCFGDGFEMAAAHVRTPTLPGGRLQLLEEVVSFEPDGGPWGRGYLKAQTVVPTDAWFYEGHFKNDPCMPGTLMADAATQALCFAMAAYGLTIERDGWRFEPTPGDEARFVCRGQVTPDAVHVLEYEVFIEEIIDGPMPTVYAALLCRSDGFKVFHCRRFGMRLVPDWPMAPGAPGTARLVGGSRDVRGDHGALQACARGRPSDAFGALYAPFDSTRRAPRLPGDPYHFVSRILSVDGAPGVPASGASVVTEYDAPSDAWYFADAESDCVPLSVLTEILLQPCGWLASYMGFAANRVEDVAFRNLDGADVVLVRLARAGVLRVTARLERFAEAGGSTIVFFHVVCTQGGDPVMTMKTAFGFFSPQALKAQVGLPASPDSIAALGGEDQRTALDIRTSHAFAGARALGRGQLALIERVTGFWPNGGAARLGKLVAESTVDPEAWFFRAHFFQDPVQPGSLGLEALQQAARALARLKGVGGALVAPCFDPVAVGAPFGWKFRGQVLPTNKRVQAEVDVISVTEGPTSALLLFDGALWVDGLRIYEVRGMGVRLSSGEGAP